MGNIDSRCCYCFPCDSESDEPRTGKRRSSIDSSTSSIALSATPSVAPVVPPVIPDGDPTAIFPKPPHGPVAPVPSWMPRVSMVIGGPGSGKGTQCRRLVDHFNTNPSSTNKWAHVSVGALLRSRSSGGSVSGDSGGSLSPDEHLSAVLASGELVNNTFVMRVIDLELRRLSAMGVTDVLLDGFPRSASQIDAYLETFGPWHRTIVLSCPVSVLRTRLLERGQCATQASEAEAGMGRPPGPPARADDTPNTIDARLERFEEELPELRCRYVWMAQPNPVQDSIVPIVKVDASAAADTVQSHLRLLTQ